MDQWGWVLLGAAVLVLVGRRMMGRQMLAATVFGLAVVVVVVWMDQSGLWPRSWRR
jgi:hypothetical protein